MLEKAQAMNVAIEDFINNWEFYLERWEKWLKEKKEEYQYILTIQYILSKK